MSTAIRVSSAYHSPRTVLPLAWASGVYYQPGGSGVNPFDVSANNPNTNYNSGPYPVQWATGRAGIDGNFTVALEAGFTAPITLIAWEYNRAANKWFRLGANTTLYETVFDTTYAQSTFEASENASILIQSTAAITQVAYIDGTLDATTVGAPMEG